MSEKLERDRAIHEFGSLEVRLFATQARMTELGGRDAPINLGVPVKSQEVLDCFLRKNPHFERFRDALAATIIIGEYRLNKERWDAYRKYSAPPGAPIRSVKTSRCTERSQNGLDHFPTIS
jgi:hypothetical protein